MSLAEVRQQSATWTPRRFLSPVGVVATEAAGEGINLQLCHLLINYDLPWNLVRLEQRMGRIHRIGHESKCVICSFLRFQHDRGQTRRATAGEARSGARRHRRAAERVGSEQVLDRERVLDLRRDVEEQCRVVAPIELGGGGRMGWAASVRTGRASTESRWRPTRERIISSGSSFSASPPTRGAKRSSAARRRSEAVETRESSSARIAVA